MVMKGVIVKIQIFHIEASHPLCLHEIFPVAQKMGLDSQNFYIHIILPYHSYPYRFAELCHSQAIRGIYELL